MAWQALPNTSVYAAQGAIIAYTRTLGVNWRTKGRINAMAPVGSTWRIMPRPFQGLTSTMPQRLPECGARRPLWLTGDICETGSVLCTEDAGSRRQTIVVDGGTSSLMSLISDFRNESTNRFGRLPAGIWTCWPDCAHFPGSRLRSRALKSELFPPRRQAHQDNAILGVISFSIVMARHHLARFHPRTWRIASGKEGLPDIPSPHWPPRISGCFHHGLSVQAVAQIKAGALCRSTVRMARLCEMR